MLLFCFVVMGMGTYLIGIEWGRDRPDGMRIGGYEDRPDGEGGQIHRNGMRMAKNLFSVSLCICSTREDAKRL